MILRAKCSPSWLNLPVEERLEQVTQFLNERGYLARWEAR